MEKIQSAGKTLHRSIYLWLVMKKSSVSCTQSPRIFRFCVMSCKGEREPTIKHCMGRQIDVVQKFITIQNFGPPLMVSQCNSRFCYKVQEFMSKMSIQPEDFTGRIIFMSMFNDISWGSKENKQECELSVWTRFDLCKKNFHQEDVLRCTHTSTPLDDSTRPLDNSTNSNSTIHKELVLW